MSRAGIVIPLCSVALVLAVVVSLAVGSVRLPLHTVAAALTSPGESEAKYVTIVRDLRLPRVLLAALVGAALAASGGAFQGLFRNSLADPFVIGASSGAALGATLAIVLGFSTSAAGLGPVPLAAFLGAVIAVALAHILAGSHAPPISLLLAGTALGIFTGACVALAIQVDQRSASVVLGWLQGSLSGRSWPHLIVSAPYIAVGVIALWCCARPLDALSLGEEPAQSLGLPLTAFRILLVAAASLATGAAVAVAGIIGFVGLIAPHAARMLVGSRHAVLFPTAILLGALLLVIADDLGRSVAAPVEIPAGIVTALIGGPFFLYLLRRQRGLGSVR